ncbi:RES domain-containing protein [Agrobacterium tumefaciens]|jgi:RES domain-containing protein|nr:RES domain-containing protein [Agrobacterium tumefaciens]
MPDLMHYQGKLYRALNPVYAREPLSGRGVELYGGRFSPKGMPALYTSVTIITALKEANQAGSLQPTTLVSCDADITPLFDTRDGALLHDHGIEAQNLGTPTWRDDMNVFGEAPTQGLARVLKNEGFCGLVVRSFAPGATDTDLNVVLWTWGDTLPHQLILINDEQRLSR